MKKIGVLVIVFSMLFTITIAPIFAAYDTIDSSRQLTQTKTYYSGEDGSVGMIVTVSSILPYIYDLTYDDQMNRSNMIVAQEYIYMIRMYNNTDHTQVFNRGFVGITATRKEFTTSDWPTNTVRYETSMYTFDDNSGNLLTSFSVNTAGMLTGYVSDRFQNGNMICLPPRSSVYSFVKVTSYFYSDAPLQSTTTSISEFDRPVQNISISYPENCHVDDTAYIYNDDYNSYVTLETVQNMYNSLVIANNRLYAINNHLTTIDSNVQIITDAYTNNSTNTTNTQSEITTTNTNEQQLHQAEQNFYQQNEQALNNVGLSNFSFSSDQSSGLGSVISDFTTLWNNIGPLQIIFTFTLSMSLATFLLRHRPITGAIKKNEKR